MKLACLWSALWLLAGCAHAADEIDPHLLQIFEPRVFKATDGQLPYRLFKPIRYDPARKYPLVIIFHGAVGSGEDNQRQFNGGNRVPATFFAAETNQARHPCFILAPQCPRNAGWSSLSSTISPQSQWVIGAMSALSREFNIDTNRFYLVGLSMGGQGVWDVASREPFLFAALIPICGAGDVQKARNVAHLPVWCFHGDKDPLVSVAYARVMIEAVKKAGGHPRYTEYPNVGHDSYYKAFAEPELLDWLFAQRRGVPPKPELKR